MGYFSNGTEGMAYEETYCEDCVHHHDGCMILHAHFVYNYDQCKNPAIKDILGIFIPRVKTKNQECTMRYVGPKNIWAIKD